MARTTYRIYSRRFSQVFGKKREEVDKRHCLAPCNGSRVGDPPARTVASDRICQVGTCAVAVLCLSLDRNHHDHGGQQPKDHRGPDPEWQPLCAMPLPTKSLPCNRPRRRATGTQQCHEGRSPAGLNPSDRLANTARLSTVSSSTKLPSEGVLRDNVHRRRSGGQRFALADDHLLPKPLYCQIQAVLIGHPALPSREYLSRQR